MKPATYRALRVTHRTLGITVGLLLVLQGITGSFMAFLPQIDRMLNPDLAAAYDPRTVRPLQDIAQDVWSARHERQQGVGVVLAGGEPSVITGYWPMPDPLVPGQLEFKLARLHPVTGEVVSEGRYGAFPDDSVLLPAYVHALHTTLTVGWLGRLILIGAGVFLLISTVIGFRIWWPGRARLAQQLKPSSVQGARWAQTVHRFVAPYAGVLIGMLVVTGIALQFIVQLDPIFHVSSSEPAGRPQISPRQAWESAERLYPGAMPQDLGAPFTPGGVFRVKLMPHSGPQASEEIELFVDNYSGEVIRVRDDSTATPVEKALGLLVPLHGGAILGFTGHVLAFIVGFLPLLLLITGVKRWREVKAARKA